MKMPVRKKVVTKTQLIDALIEIRHRANTVETGRRAYLDCLEWQRCHEEAEKLTKKYVEYPAVDPIVDTYEDFKRILMGTEYKVLYAFFVNLLERYIPNVNKYYFNCKQESFKI